MNTTQNEEVVVLENTPDMELAVKQLCKDICTDDATNAKDFVKNLRISTENTHIENINNDYERELVFYQQALVSVNKARKWFREINYPYKRPVDYYAEMLKSDKQMEKIRPQLMKIQKKIEIVEQRKKNVEIKKKENQMKKVKRREDAIQRLKQKKEKKKQRFRDKALSMRGKSSNPLQNKSITGPKKAFSKRTEKGGKGSKGSKKQGGRPNAKRNTKRGKK
ncbi:hypothetical protein QTN25_003847 [Entamoeba marina]